MSATIEMVSFKLNEGATTADILATSPAISAWVIQQAGFQYRSLAQQSDGQWLDIVYWESLEHAQQAGEAFMKATEPKAMMAFIDKTSVSVQHIPVMDYVLAPELAGA